MRRANRRIARAVVVERLGFGLRRVVGQPARLLRHIRLRARAARIPGLGLLERVRVGSGEGCDDGHQVLKSGTSLRAQKNGVRPCFWVYSARMFASFTTRPHFTKSALIFSVVCAGERISVSQPVALIWSSTVLSAPALASACVHFVTTSCGRPAGPRMPYHAVESKPLSPTSSIVGTSGNACERC